MLVNMYNMEHTVQTLLLIAAVLQFCIPHLLGFDEIFSGPPEIKDTAEPPPF